MKAAMVISVGATVAKAAMVILVGATGRRPEGFPPVSDRSEGRDGDSRRGNGGDRPRHLRWRRDVKSLI